MEGFGLESQVSSDDEGVNSDKLVPVSEAIRYRKRAQIAEKKAAELQEQLKEAVEKKDVLAGKVSEIKLEHDLADKLITAGAVDLEAAMLIAKSRMQGDEQADADVVIEQLRKQKGYLFDETEHVSAASKTAGVKERVSSGKKVLERAAKKAATSGNRADLQEYLRLRRQYV
jgi:hypothetical protein